MAGIFFFLNFFFYIHRTCTAWEEKNIYRTNKNKNTLNTPERKGGKREGGETNSKHRFTTSFLQPLPYLVTPLGPENCQLTSSFFVGAQTVVSVLQTTQIKQGVSFIAANKVCTSTNKTIIVWIETELFFLRWVDASHVYVRALALGCFYSHISTQTFRRALTASLDSCTEIKSTPSVA